MWIRTITVLAALVPAMAMAQPYPAYRPPPHLTTASAQYCDHLRGELARAQDHGAPMPPEAQLLAMEGNRMCDRGHYLGGVVRLRRALAIMRDTR
jgi:hypothetical protein